MAYLNKSKSFLISANILLDNNRLEESVSMVYYSMYYSVIALFYKVGIKCENHTATIILLKDLFKLDNSELLAAKKERINKQYYVDFSITKGEVKELIKDAENFKARLLDFLERITNDEISKFRKDLKNLLKRK